MRSSFDYYKRIESPEMYLCNPDQRFLCSLTGENRTLTLRFNDLSELSFTVPKIEGTEGNYNLIESKRLIFVDKIGWFQISTVSESVEGDTCSKNVTAKSHQTIFSDRGFVTEERVYMFYNPNDPLDEKYDSSNGLAIPSVVGQLYQQLGIRVALSNSDIEPSYDRKDWTLIYIDPILKFRSRSYSGMYEPADDADNICRSFDAKTDGNGYDFMVNEVEEAFEVVFEFDFLYHTIKVKTLEDITKPTSIYLSFQNVINSIDIKENAEDIVTVMTCEGDDLDIRTVNPMGTNYIVDFSYYKKLVNDDGVEYPWMSKELIEALDDWEAEFEKWRQDDSSRTGHTKGYSTLVKEIQELYTQKSQSDADIQYANLKLTDMQAARDQYLNEDDKPLDGSGYVTAESVEIGGNSMLSRSRFYTEAFSDAITLIGHTKGATATKVFDDEEEKSYHYEFAFEDEGISGTPRSFIEEYINSDSIEDNTGIPFYFMDEDDRSYCKLTVESEVGVVKDADGFIANNGTVEVRGVTFTVSSLNGAYTITLPDGNTINASQSNSYFVYAGNRYRILSGADGIVTVYAFYVSGFERYTTYTETRGDDGWCSIWEAHINNDLLPINEDLEDKISEIAVEMEYICDQCNIQKYIQRRGQELYDELTVYWIEGTYSNNNFATYDTSTMADMIDLANELMDAAKVDLQKSSQPQFTMTVDSINFIKILEFKQFTDELNLGRVITIEREDGVYYRPALMSLEYDLDATETFTMTFSNASKPGDTSMTFADLIKESSTTSRTVSSNWSNLTDYSRNKAALTDLVLAPLDRTLRAAMNNMASQAFIIDDTGILGRKYSDKSDMGFAAQQMRIMNNVLLFTDDNWTTCKTALGNIVYLNDDGEEVQAYGLIAEAIIGDLILGRELQIRNDAGTILLNEDGILIKNDGGDAVFEADHYGNLTIIGEITATKLTLLEGVTIGYDHVSDAPDPKGFIFTVDQNKRATLNTNADAISLSAGQLSITSENFTLDTDGKITAKGAHIEGEIDAEGGSIGGFTIGNTSLYNGCDTMSRNDGVDGVYLGVDGINIGGGNFTISKSGVLQTKKGEILLGQKSTASDKVDDYYIRLTPGTLSVALEATYNDNTKDRLGTTLSYGYLDMSSTDALNLYGGGTNYLAINTRGDGEYTPSGTYVQASTDGAHLASLTVGATNLSMSSLIRMSVAADGMNSWMRLLAINGELQGTWQLSDGAAITSDRQHKNSIEVLDDKYEQLFDALNPVRFKYNKGTSGRYHTGFIAQDVKEAVSLCGLDSNEFAAYLDITYEDGETMCCLRYDEFIALCVKEIQKLKSRVRELELNKEKNE